MENRRSLLCLILTAILLEQMAAATCGRERCCSSDPCTTLYCQQKNSQTWISTENFYDYQFTKLVMADNQCKPCPNNCKTCTTPDTCSTCYSGYYLKNGKCSLCDYKCLVCTEVNDLKKCSECDDGTYLDSNTLTCKSCPMGAETCSSETTIISCQNGYQKSSNSLFCTPCSSNCVSCPSSTTFCSVCESGYYLSSGSCRQCNVSNCNTCIGVGSNVYCQQCKSGYILISGQCRACPTQCTTCSSTTVCTTCNTGYYRQSGGCSAVTTAVANCQTYSAATTCSACQSGYYLGSNTCLPCSILCQTCTGAHFGTCSVCESTANLFNQMCIVDPFPSATKYRMYVTLPADNALLSGGTLGCSSLLYSGTTLSLRLDNIYGFKIVLQYKIFTDVAGQQYNISLNDDIQTLSSSSSGYQICNSTSLYLHKYTSDLTFSNIALENTLTFASTSSSLIHLSEILITVFKCNSLCLECSESECFQCMNDNLYTQNAYCVYVCGSGYYTYEQGKQCVSNCPLRTFALLTNASCMACSSPCYTCLSEKYCLSCEDGYFLNENNTCEVSCPYRYYGSAQTQKCEKCVGRCNECVSDEQCINCQVGFLEGTTCVDDCQQPGYYEDLDNLTCEPCSSECAQCEYVPTYCLSCASGLIFFNNTCLAQCNIGYYSDGVQCLACSYPCEACENSSTICLSCEDSYLLNSGCVSPCPNGYYEDNVNLACELCSSNCTTCYSAEDNCLDCASGFYWIDYKCVEVCPEGFYEDTYNEGLGICSPCSNLCKDCTNASFCLACMSNFLNEQGLCVRASLCPDGQYAEIDTLNCLPCDSSCVTCKYEASACTSCPGDLILYESTCVTECPSVYYFNDSFVCSLCEQPCLTCIDASQCLSCVQGYKYSNSNHVCSSTCSVGTFFNNSINDCSECSSNCLACENSGFCYLCAQSYYLHVLGDATNQCVSECPETYYPDGLSCMACLYPCLTCTSTIDCVTCDYGVMYQSRCLAGCPDSTYKNGDTCDNCGGNCLTCKDTATKCVSCQPTFYLLVEDCVSTCPVGSYAFTVTQQCVICPSTCSQCLNSTYCTACITNTTYLNKNTNACQQFCPSGMYGSNSTGSCESCAAKCLTCLGAADKCLVCAASYILVKLEDAQFDCLTSCPSKFYEDNGVCYSCIFPCSECLSAVACLTCASGTYFHQNSSSCLLNCPMGTYYVYEPLAICETCVSPCETCLNDTNCISCEGSLLLFEGTCVAQCPQMYYADSSGLCNRCYGLCKTCSNKYYCLTCHTGFSYDGFCYSACPPGTYASQQTRKCEACEDPCLECTSQPTYCKRCQFNMFAYKGECSEECPMGTYQSGQVCVVCQFPCVDCLDQFSCQQCIGGYLLYSGTTCIESVEKCPNDLYKKDSKECVPFTWCPEEYYKDEILKTCSLSCNRDMYVQEDTRICGESCQRGQYVSTGMVCKNWATSTPSSLMTMELIAFIKSSEMHIAVTFNETASWDESGDNLFTLINNDLARRLLAAQDIAYKVSQDSVGNEKDLALRIQAMPYSVKVHLPAHYVHSSVSGYPLQEPDATVLLPQFTAYTYEQVYNGSVLRQFSEGVSWFIILFSLFFLFVNRLSDVYILWDTAQLLYLLIFLHIQYPPNLNQFLAGMSNTHFLFVPSLFSTMVPSSRFVSDQPFYAYSFDCSFLRTAGSPILIILIVLIIFLILKFIELLNNKSDRVQMKLAEYPTVKKYLLKGILRFRWHHTSDLFFLTYDIIILFAVAELVKMRENPNNIASNAIAVIFALVYLAFPCFVGYKLNKHYENIARGKLVVNLQCFYRGIEKTNKFGVFLILLRYFRKIVYCIIIGVFSMEPMFALPILMFTSVLMGLFIFINKPFKKRLSNNITIATEVALVLVFMLIALLNFSSDSFSINLKLVLGWICCLLLCIMLFALVFQVFCKTMFYLEPQANSAPNSKGTGGKDKGERLLQKDLTEEYIRKKAGEFFQFIFPRLKKEFNMDDSEDEMIGYEEGDSENSENNNLRERGWGLDSDEDSKHSDEFRHYGDEQSETQMDNKRPPTYLIRCVKELE